jgi:hypothetical protein
MIIQYPDCVYFPRFWPRWKCEQWAINRNFGQFQLASNGNRTVLLYDITKWYNFAQ